MLAMIAIETSPKLQNLGFKQLLQIHDEVILEGPEEHAEEALVEVKRCMEEGLFDVAGIAPLRVKLEVDANIAPNWSEGK